MPSSAVVAVVDLVEQSVQIPFSQAKVAKPCSSERLWNLCRSSECLPYGLPASIAAEPIAYCHQGSAMGLHILQCASTHAYDILDASFCSARTSRNVDLSTAKCSSGVDTKIDVRKPFPLA